MRKLKYWNLWLALGWCYAGIIIYLSLISYPPKVMTFEFGDKVKHLAGYALLMAWFVLLYKAPRLQRAHAAGFIAMGVGLEMLQGYGGLRSMELADGLANAAGVGLGWALGALGGMYRSRE